MTLSVVLDGTMLSGAAGFRGIGTYTRELARSLAAAGEVRVLALDPGVELPPGVEPVTVRRRAPGRLRAVEHDLLLSSDLRRAGADVAHSTGTDPPRRPRRPLVQTLFDVIPLVFDDPALAPLRRRWARLAPRYRAADAVVAISRHAADEGIRHLGLDPRKVTVAHLGVSPSFSPEGPRAPGDEPYLLLVGEYARRKGFAEAFAVIDALAAAGYPHRLKVAGRLVPWTEPTVAALRGACAHPERIDLLGWVEDLPALYRSSRVVVLTSRHEGFGLPAVEAMASGVPLVAFDNSSIGEVVDGGGVLVADGDTLAFTAAVRQLLDDGRHHAEMASAGRTRAHHFDWATCAAAHTDVYRQVAGR